MKTTLFPLSCPVGPNGGNIHIGPPLLGPIQGWLFGLLSNPGYFSHCSFRGHLSPLWGQSKLGRQWGQNTPYQCLGGTELVNPHPS